MEKQQEKRKVQWDEEVIFHNWTDKDYLGFWMEGPYKISSSPVTYSKVQRKTYELKAGKSYYLPFYLAEKFAKEITDREYWTAFNAKLDKMRSLKGNERLDRRILEHLVESSNEIRTLNRQEMMDKCVEIIDNEEVEMVRPKEVLVKEVMLKRDENARKLRERFPGIETPRVNEKAIKEAEQFENA